MVKRWEYTVIDLVSGQPVTVELGKAWLDQTIPILQQMGDQGWELVQIFGACAYFKREAEELHAYRDAIYSFLQQG